MLELVCMIYDSIYRAFIGIFIFDIATMGIIYFFCITIFWFYLLLSVVIILCCVMVAGRLHKKNYHILQKTQDRALIKLNNIQNANC